MGLTRIRAQQITDIDYKQAVRVTTTGDVVLAGGAPNTVDGVSLQVDNRVLVRAQSNAAQNGIYFVSVLGSGSDGTWLRTNDANQTGEIDPGMVVMVTEGVAYADTPWKLITNGEIIIGVTELTFEQFSSTVTAAGANTQIQYNDNGAFAGSANLTWDGANLTVTGSVLSGNILPTANNVFSLGNATAVWTDLFLSNSTIYLGEATISASGADLLLPNSVHIGNVVLSDDNGMLSMPESITVANLIATANVTVTGNITGDYFVGNGSQLTGLPEGYGNANVVTLLSAFGSNTVSTTGNISGGNLITDGLVSVSSITKTGSNGVGNIGSVTSTFDTVFAKATSAQYADLAEKYLSDNFYSPGTVVVFGGTKEITQSLIDHDHRIAGVISTDPAFIMNNLSDGLSVALTGRVPCRVQGPVSKGDLVVSSNIPGTAQRLDIWRPGCVIGKSLEDISDDSIKTIEVVVGRV